jgi:aconitate hydratase
MQGQQDPFGSRARLQTRAGDVFYARLEALERAGVATLNALPYTIRILLENVLRSSAGGPATEGDVRTVASWTPGKTPAREVPFMPGRVVFQDFTGVPSVVDLAAMRDAMAEAGGDPGRVNPVVRTDLVIDHSVQVDYFGSEGALALNIEREFERNRERYLLLKWAQQAFDNLRVVPPGTGIVHQVNLEYLASVVLRDREGAGTLVYPDTVVGADSHTTMINGLGVLGWGVGGIEAEAVMLAQPYFMLVPEVVGVRLTGRLPEGATATDLVLTITEILRKTGVVEKFVEFFGPGLAELPVADRATIANMSPEYGATCGYFPVDEQTLRYLRLTGRDEAVVDLVDRYFKAQGLFWTRSSPDPAYSRKVDFDLSTVEPSMAGPKRPQDRVRLPDVARNFFAAYPDGDSPGAGVDAPVRNGVPVKLDGQDAVIGDASVVIAAITSCTNTSNPSVMIGAGLVARNALARGLTNKPWVKTSMAPGSRVVTSYLERSGLLKDLERLGFGVVGYGCTTCIGNSGPLPQPVAEAVQDHDLVAAAVLSGNRNFEGRVHPQVKANYLASPMLVVAYALAGRVDIDLSKDPLGTDVHGRPVFLREIWPSQREIADTMARAVGADQFRARYGEVFKGDETWAGLPVPEGQRYRWDPGSTYIQRVPFFDGMAREPGPLRDIVGARVLVSMGDSVTTDHISPAGSIPPSSPAGQHMIGHDVPRRDFNSYGARRGNHEVMVRGTFGNIRLKNLLTPDREGDWTMHHPDGEVMRVFDAAVKYQAEGVPLIVIAGREYGTGSSRDWAAKGPMLLGVKAALAQSLERIHRSNLIGMGVLPLQFKPGESAASLGLNGRETYEIRGIAADLSPGSELHVTATAPDGRQVRFGVIVRIDTPIELEYYRHGGVLNYVLRKFLAEARSPSASP